MIKPGVVIIVLHIVGIMVQSQAISVKLYSNLHRRDNHGLDFCGRGYQRCAEWNMRTSTS